MARAIPNWLARFNRKMSFHFPWVVPLISDRSVWHNGKQPRAQKLSTLQVHKLLQSILARIGVSTVASVLILESFRFEDENEDEDEDDHKVQLLLIVRMLKSVTVMA